MSGVEPASGSLGHREPAGGRNGKKARESEFVFTTLRGNHYRPSSRSHHWNRVRCSAGLGSVDLYTDRPFVQSLMALFNARTRRN